jgi:DNA-binding response OmpR family regulator
LALIDLMLPGEMDGIELCRLIKESEKFKNMKVVIVTAVDKKKQIDDAMAAGADLIIQKPFLPKEIVTQINTLMQKPKKRSGKHRVLILDDEENDGELAKSILEKQGHQVLVLNTATGALLEIKNFAPDLILLDVMMPEIAGQDLARIILKHGPLNVKPKILYYSNLSADKLKELVRDTDVHGYVCKTEGPRSLISAVESLLQDKS